MSPDRLIVPLIVLGGIMLIVLGGIIVDGLTILKACGIF